MAKGDHIYVERLNGVYAHHGIDCGDGTVIHYTAEKWSDNRQVQRTSIEVFAREGDILIRDYSDFFDALKEPGSYQKKASYQFSRIFNRIQGVDVEELDLSEDATIARAEARIGEKAFNIMIHNCEHFACWCKTGIANSEQADAVWKMALSPPQFARYRANNAMLKVFEPSWPGKR